VRGFKVGLALGGGGVRALAHIGVLKLLERENIPIDLISGTSMGAIIGAGFALTLNIAELEEKILILIKRKEIIKLESLAATSELEEKQIIFERLSSFVKELLLWNLRAVKRCVIDSAQIENLIKEIVGESSFKEVKIPFTAVATDLEKGEEVLLCDGRIREALLASAAIPGIFAPVTLGGRILVDGGVVSLVPVRAVKNLGADFIIGVNVQGKVARRGFDHGINIFFQSDSIRAQELNRLKLKECDFIIEPDVSDISWAQYSRGRDCIRKGEEATLEVIDDIKELIKKKRRKKWIRKFIFFAKEKESLGSHSL
jgi:NTE family protein